jgi:Ca-activated chloride channel family protein
MKNPPFYFQTAKLIFIFLLFFYSCTSYNPNEAKKKSEENAPPAPPVLEDQTQTEAERAEEAPNTTDHYKDVEKNGLREQKSPNTGTENREEYEKPVENPFFPVQENPLSTFSIDVDNAAYSNIRRFLTYNQLPPAGAVRIEEMINYFDYEYPQPKGEHPFSIYTEMGQCPWDTRHQLIHIGLQGKELDYENIKPSNLVFLVDASGSMADQNKLPLLKKSLALLLDNLKNQDRIAIVAYVGAAGLVLPSTSASQKSKILSALDDLEAGGSTAGGQGIELAYKIAQENLIRGGNNRVILCTDGDFNVGTSSDEGLVKLIEEKRKSNIFLTICGFGMGNYKDRKMEMISNAGNGNYFYIDHLDEAKKVFVKEMRANMFTIAKDVKIQIEFNPTKVKAYRLIGYENRVLKNEDFEDDKKDAGELGAGHSVTALYEIIPAESNETVSNQKDLKYQKTVINPSAFKTNEVMTIKFRYKAPQSETSQLITHNLVPGANQSIFSGKNTENFRFSAAVAGWGMLLKDSQYKGNLSYEMVYNLAKYAISNDEGHYKSEFLDLVKKSQKAKR